MHWDIKPENFFIAENWVVKLGDFGESKHLDKGNITAKHTGKVGTEMYMSPEMIKKHKGRDGAPYSFKTDIWGVGMVIAELMCLDYAFDVEDQYGRVMAIAKGKNYRDLPEIYPEPLRNLARQMLSLDPHDRPTAEEACIEIENFMSESNLTFDDF